MLRGQSSASVILAMIKLLCKTCAFELNGSARMNFPSTLGGNWSWRMTEDQLTPAVEQELLDFTTIYRREK